MKMNSLNPGWSMWLIALLIASAVVSCKSKSVVMESQQKTEVVQLLESKQYRVDFTTAYPQQTTTTNRVVNDVMLRTGNSAARIDIAGNGDYLTVNQEQGSADLPFFGERRFSTGYNNIDIGINYNNTLTDYTVSDEQSHIQVSFDARGENDQYQITLRIYGNKSVRAFVNSNNHTTMSYDGILSPLELPEE
jgi:hypothetical protein